MSTEVGSCRGDDHHMTYAALDEALAPWAHILLACLIRLDRLDDLVNAGCSALRTVVVDHGDEVRNPAS